MTTARIVNWNAILAQLAIHFVERVKNYLQNEGGEVK